MEEVKKVSSGHRTLLGCTKMFRWISPGHHRNVEAFFNGGEIFQMQKDKVALYSTLYK